MLCAPASVGEEEASKRIERELKEEQRKRAKLISLLLLGPGESGKSTLFKQIRLLNSATWDKEERHEFRKVLRGNLLSQMRLLSVAAKTELSEKAAQAGARLFAQPQGDLVWTPELIADVKTVAADPAVVKAISCRASELQLLDSLPYLLENMGRIFEPDFVPTDDDILRSRKMTTSIVELEWETKGIPFKLVDVGGQRSQRSKWIHFFTGVNAVLFVLAIGDYDMVLREDASTNRMTEALTMFASLVNSQWFCNIDFIIFFNKDDVFEEKAKKVDLKCCFPEYKGGKDPVAAREFVRDRFLKEVKKGAKAKTNSSGAPPTERHIYTHFTCATDSKQIKKIWESVHHGMTQNALGQLY